MFIRRWSKTKGIAERSNDAKITRVEVNNGWKWGKENEKTCLGRRRSERGNWIVKSGHLALASVRKGKRIIDENKEW